MASNSADWQVIAEYGSASKPGQFHKVGQAIAGPYLGHLRCSCSAFIFQKGAFENKSCKHTRLAAADPLVLKPVAMLAKGIGGPAYVVPRGTTKSPSGGTSRCFEDAIRILGKLIDVGKLTTSPRTVSEMATCLASELETFVPPTAKPEATVALGVRRIILDD